MVAKKVADEVGIDQYVAACLPEDKIKYVNGSQEKGKVVGMIGDGINDAPALANANIGIAMGSGSSIAMESSDVVIVKNNLSDLMVAKKVADEVGIDQYVAACLPEDKIKYVNGSQEKGKVVGMIGDGINDAPALANANIGIAMGSGSSIAMESSDVVIVKNNL